ncbi:MAG TPA: hypothetical protein DCP31_28940, partial [Cyanobacteria bacterium UBA8543]|nr:hypothetical protein [Cyanobacteria bacterium UBA8543]
MSIQNILADRKALEQFKETHPERGTIQQIVALPEDEFVQTYAADFADGVQQARRVYQLAIALQQQSALVWANLKDLASPFTGNTLFNNIPASFLEHQQAIPGYDRLFGNLDYIECEPCRSVFGPAAYFVDLMRFVEELVTERNPGIPEAHRLENRRPDLFNLKLDCANTNDLIAYIDLVNEALETIVATPANPNADRVLHDANFPSNLPYNVPLEEIRTYLSQLKLSLCEIYQTFETSPPTKTTAISRERLNLSLSEFEIVRTELTAPINLRQYYGLGNTQTLASLATVSTFLEKTGLSRQELNELLFQDLDQYEVNQLRLSRLFFINQADDGLSHLQIKTGESDPNSFYQVPQEQLVNLSPAKLDRIYRFVKLARKLGWSFTDLDWALRSLHFNQSPERVLYFDGVNDVVTVQNVTKLNLSEFTIEAWINPARAKTNPILYKGENLTVDNPRIHFLFGLDADNQLVFHTQSFNLSGTTPIPLGVFTHVAVTVSNSQVRFYINGKPETLTQGTIAPIPPIGTTLNIGADLGYESFAGSIQDVRIWQGVRSEAEIDSRRYHRFTGQKIGLVAYWPLVESASNPVANQVSDSEALLQSADRTANPNHGTLGGAGAVTQPKWVPQDLVLDPFPGPLEQTAYQFNGDDQYLAIEASRGLTIDASTGNQLTLEAWVNLAESQGNTIFRIGAVNATDAEFEFGVTSGEDLGIAVRGNTQTSSAPDKILLNQWTHVAVTIQTIRDNTQVQFYVNGESIFTGSLPAPIVITDADLDVGRNLRGNYFSGQLREVRFWNQARTPEQIRQTLHQVLPTRTPGLIGYWRLNQITAGTAQDLSYNQNHLLLGGIPEDFMPDRILLTNHLLPPTPIATTGTVLDLDGINDVIVVSNPQNDGLGQYSRLTLELWFKAADLEQRHAQRQVIYSQGDSKAGLSAYVFETRLFVIAWCQDSAGQIQETLLSSDPLSDNQWYHLAITNDETRSLNAVEFRAYLDGNPLLFTSSNHVNNANLPNERKGYPLSRQGVAYVGGIAEPGITRFQGLFNTDEQHHFAGQIIDLRLWKRVKTANEINAERFTAPELTHPDLVAYLPMNDGKGETVRDSEALLQSADRSSNGYTGTLARRNLVFLTDNANTRFNTLNAYYNPANGDALSWTNYAYTGRIYLSETFNGRMGVAFYSRRVANASSSGTTPETILRERDYRLQWQRNGNTSALQLVNYPSNQPIVLSTPNSVPPVITLDRWYRFHIEVENNTAQNRTDIRAKVWLEDTPEPQEFQWVATDDSSDRSTAGTIGIWTTSDRSRKWFDDLQVISLPTNTTPPTLLLTESFESYAPDQNPSNWVDVGDRQINLSPEVLLDQNFGRFRDNQNPTDWQDTAGNYSRTVDNTLFTTNEQGNNTIFRTVSGANDIHSHYAATGVLNWSNYSYSGRLSFTDPGASLGVTFYSRYPDTQATGNAYDSYYRLERVRPSGNSNPNSNPVRFQLIARRNGATASLQGTLTVDLTLPRNTSVNNTWYRFRIEAENTGSRIQIRAKVWLNDTQEPDKYQINAFDDVDARERPRTGTVGLWAAGNGEKRFDDLRVERLPVSRLESIVDDRLFRTADAQDNTARWQTISTYPLLLRPLSRRALRFNGQTEYLAANNLKGLTGNQFAIAAWVNPSQHQPNPVFSWQDGTSSRFIWFGITATGNLTLFADQPGNMSATGGIVGSTPIPVGQFTHIAVSVNGDSVTFFVNGTPEATQTFPVPLSFNPTTLQVGRFFNTYLAGELRDLRLWNTARSAADLASERRYQQPDLSSPDLVGYWSLAQSDGVLALDASESTNHLRLGGIEGARQPMLMGSSSANPVTTAIELNDATLQELATLRQLQARHNLPIDRLTALWFEIRHTGRGDGQTLFDRVFNGRGITGEHWNYSQYPIRWDVTGQNRRDYPTGSASDRDIRSRLMGALQVSSEDLDRLVRRLSNSATPIELDGFNLSRLYHLAQLPKVLRLTVQDFLRLLDLMNLTEVNTLEEFKQVSDRVDWLQRTGIQVSELEFLTSPTLSNQIPLPYMEVAIRDLATTLTNQSSEFLVTPSSFVSDLVNLSQSMEIFEFLKSAKILDELEDELAAVSVQYQSSVNLPAISGLPIDPDLRLQLQTAIQTQVENTLSRMQQEHANAIVERLAELFQVEPERLRIVQSRLSVTPSIFLGWMRAIVTPPDRQPLPAALTDYLYQLSQGLYVINRFALTTDEASALLQNPERFSITNVFNPTIADLEHLVMFTELKTAFNDVNGGLIQVLNQATDSAILDVTNWDENQLKSLTNYFGNASTAHRIPELHRLYRAFALADTLQVNIEFLIQLANTENLTIDFYRQQSAALLNVVRSRYDDDQWQRVYKPIRDRLATQKRDALLSYALPRQLPADFPGRRDAEVLYEYLLLDVQIGSEVETSRIAQGIAALQLYVQRCQLNLEQGVNPETIPADQWNWMKNYRVWEANRKVFLYPESYIEPELRDTKTPEFEALEQELMQGEINQANVEKAFNNYLNKLADLTDLKIVGAYVHRELTQLPPLSLSSETLNLIVGSLNRGLVHPVLRDALRNSGVPLSDQIRVIGNVLEWRLVDSDRAYLLRLGNNGFTVTRTPAPPIAYETFYLIGRSTTQPRRYYYRERVNETRWLPWKTIDLAISADFVTPVYAFGRLFLFWVEFTEQRDRTVQQNQESEPVYQPQIMYSYLDLNQTWVAPQVHETYFRQISAAERSFPFWQRVYAVSTADRNISLGFTPVGSSSERLLVIYGDTNAPDPIPVRPILNGRERAMFTLQFLNRYTAGAINTFSDDLAISLPYRGRISIDPHRATLNTAANPGSQPLQDLPEGLRNLQNAIRTPAAQFLVNPQDSIRFNDNPDFRVSQVGHDRWVVTIDDGQRSQQLLIKEDAGWLSIYDFSQAFLHFSRVDNANISDYVSASDPFLNLTETGTDPASLSARGANPLITNVRYSRNNQLLPTIPLESSILDVNNQVGWYILDTGVDYYLITPETNIPLQTDTERLGAVYSSNNFPFYFQTNQALRVAFTSTDFARLKFERIDASAVRELSQTLFREGLDGLLSLRSQRTAERPLPGGYNPNRVIPPASDQIDFNGAYGIYYQEVFFHIPFFIANQLNANQNFAEAQRWYHYIFNPTTQEPVNGAANSRYWQFLPFRNLTLESLTDILNNQAALAEYRRDPFDPHAIAQLRINAYQKAIVMKYIDNLLDWGDYLFNQNNRESIGEAAQLYVLAYNLLGQRPEGRANRKFEEIGNYNGIREAFTNPPDFLADVSLSNNGSILTTFCVTENAEFVSFWDRVSDRLFKIRHSLNIDGVFRQLDLFQPALDVRALVAAFASGDRDVSSILADVNRPVPHYRYGYMLDKAKEMTEIVIGLGEKLLEAIQNRDAEQLATLQNTHERNILDLMSATRESEIEVVQQEIAALGFSKQRIQDRQSYYETLLADTRIIGSNNSLSLIFEERAAMDMLSGAAGTRAGQIAFKTIGAIFGFASYDSEIPVANLRDGFSLSGDIFAAAADMQSATAGLLATIAEYRRRRSEWEQERTNIAFELQEIDQQIEIANLRLRMAEHELTIHRRSIEQSQEIANFYRRKFSNEQLYNWMIGRISGLYFQAYKLAYATAKDTERAFQYEFGDNSSFINFGHWDSLRRGLLAGESLQLDLMRLEKYAIDQDSRYQEIEKTISLKNTTFFQDAFQTLRTTGACTFKLSERMFDLDYPGHFFRIIKSIAISVRSPSVQPDHTLNATLIQLNNRALLEPDIEGVRY